MLTCLQTISSWRLHPSPHPGEDARILRSSPTPVLQRWGRTQERSRESKRRRGPAGRELTSPDIGADDRATKRGRLWGRDRPRCKSQLWHLLAGRPQAGYSLSGFVTRASVYRGAFQGTLCATAETWIDSAITPPAKVAPRQGLCPAHARDPTWRHPQGLLPHPTRSPPAAKRKQSPLRPHQEARPQGTRRGWRAS